MREFSFKALHFIVYTKGHVGYSIDDLKLEMDYAHYDEL